MSSPVVTELELSFVLPRYAHTRVAEPAAVRRLADSLERFGQLSPVIVVPEGGAEPSAPGRFVLLDGYRRLAALSQLRRDTLLAQVWPMEEPEALLRLLGERRDRPWEAIEEAQLLAELRARFGLSLERLAARIGRDAGWVSRRLSLVDVLPPDAASAVASGRLSTWAATRVVAPLARANPDHAARLTASLAQGPLGTRDLALWWGRYAQANRAVRDEMVAHPAAFVRALRAERDHATARSLAQGPEGQVLGDARALSALLRRLTRLLPTVLAPSQLPEERSRLLCALRPLLPRLSSLHHLIEEVTRDFAGEAPVDPLACPPGGEPKRDGSPASGGPQDRAPGAQRPAGR